jgi:translation initiation factor IF-2
MTQPDERDTAPGAGDPTRSDDIDSAGLRSNTGGRGAEDAAAGPAPHAGDSAEIRPDPDPGRSGPLGGVLGSAGGGYGTGSGFGSSGGSPDGEDVQAQSGPGPQTDWLRSAPGEGPGASEDAGPGAGPSGSASRDGGA